MDIDLHSDALDREQLFIKYLTRRIAPAAADSLETHYLQCDECFDELRTTEILLDGLECQLVATWKGDVLVLGFAAPAHLTRKSIACHELLGGVRERTDTKVLIDLSQVSRIDSSGLGLLMNCYSHAVKTRGMLKVLNPSTSVRKVFDLTRMTEVLESYDEEAQALESFSAQSKTSAPGS